MSALQFSGLAFSAALRALPIIPREPISVTLEDHLEDELGPEELRQLFKRFNVHRILIFT